MPFGQVQVPFPDNSMPGTPNHPQESGGRIINAYVEPLGPAAPNTLIYRRAPGLRNFGTTAQTGFRGGMEVQGTLYAAFVGQLMTFSAGGGAGTSLGSIGGAAKGFFARNNKSGEPDKVFVDPSGTNFSFVAAGTITSPIDTDLPAPNSVCSIDGFFVYTISDGRVFASDLNSLAINALSFATAESKPDGLTRAIPWAGNLFLYGPATTEVWANVGTTPFPFQRSVVIPRGIAGPYCVAGFEDNFSRALVWVADDNTVVRLNGYSPEKISPPDLDGLIEAVTDKSQLEMSVFMSRGHGFVLLSSPTWSWVFDLNNNRWAERQSYLTTRSRITGGLFAFNKWLCGDTLSGGIYEITNEVHSQELRVGVTGTANASGRVRLTVTSTAGLADSMIVTVAGVGGTTEANGTWSIDVTDATHLDLKGSTFVNAYTSGGTVRQFHPFRWRLESGAVENFPVGARVGRFDCEFVTGVGQATGFDPIQTDPVVEISWSDDGGITYYAPIRRKLGRQQMTRNLVSLISCTGRSGWTARRWRLDISDPVHVGFMAAYQNISPKVSDIV